MSKKHYLLIAMAWLMLAWQGAMAAVSVGAYATIENLLTPTLTINTPAGAKGGDLLLVQIVSKDWVTMTPPSGWTEYTAASRDWKNLRTRYYWRIAPTSVAASYSWALAYGSDSDGPKSAGTTGLMLSMQTTDTSNPFCGTNNQTQSTEISYVAPNLHTTCPAGSRRFAFFSADHSDTIINPNAKWGDASYTAIPDAQTTGDGRGVSVAGSYFTMSGSGNGDSLTATLTVSKNGISNTIIVKANPESAVDHIQLELTGTPLTCTPSTVTIKACSNAACSTLASAATTVTLTTNNGSWGSSPITFTGSTTTTLRNTTVSTATLGASSNPGAANATTCYLNGVQASGCQIPFVDSALLLTIPTQTAGVTSSGTSRMSVSAVRASDNALQCIPAFASVNRVVDFWSEYSNPNSGIKTVAVNGTTVVSSTTTLAASTSTTGTAVTLSFDANGTATVPLKYDDAGQVLLKARYDGSASNATYPDAGLVMKGSSTFVSVPYALCVDSSDSGWSCNAADLTCAKYKKAGENFNLRVTGKAYLSTTTDVCAMTTTANYQQNGLTLASVLVQPAGGNSGALGTGTINISSGGTATISNQTQAEVGVFKFTATPPAATASNNYFGQTVPTGTSQNFGRFVPAGFTVTGAALTPRNALTCSPASTFTYLGEALGLGFTLNAVNVGGTITSNYRGSFARLGLAPATASGALYFGAQDGTTLLNSRTTTACTGSSGVCGTWGNGTATIAANTTVSRASAGALDGPFTAAKFGLKATDADGVTVLSPNYNWSLVTPVLNDGLLIGNGVLRFGRVRMSNAYGSALLPLPVPTIAQYWNGSAFVLNTDDNCTPLTAPTVQAIASTSQANLYCYGGAGLYGSLSGVTASVNAKMAAGQAGLKLGKPSNSNGGYLDLALAVPNYLKYNWNGSDQDLTNCSAASDGDKNDDNPRALIRFGAKQNNSIIYLREIY